MGPGPAARLRGLSGRDDKAKLFPLQRGRLVLDPGEHFFFQRGQRHGAVAQEDVVELADVETGAQAFLGLAATFYG